MKMHDKNILLHFTTCEGLKGILKSNSLRLTHYASMKDRSELSAIQPNDIKKMLLSNGFHPNNVKIYQESMDLAFRKDFTGPYIISFHSIEKTALKCTDHMWKEYARNGVAIIFDKDELVKQIDSITHEKALTSNVCYTKELLRKTGTTLKSFQIGEKFQRVNKTGCSEDAISIFHDDCLIALQGLATDYIKMRWLTKKRKYRNEHEFRIILSEIKSNSIFRETKINHKDKSISVVEIPINELPKYVKGILLDPIGNRDKLRNDIQKLLAELNLEHIDLI
ncbi:MAG: DUF2971 domain-containing protein [Gammaproteobacteria bacterium]